eukprot:gene28419-31562_t
MGQGWDMTTSGHTMMLATAVSLKSGSASEVSVPVVWQAGIDSPPCQLKDVLQAPFPAGTALHGEQQQSGSYHRPIPSGGRRIAPQVLH